jgi:hypothetical protein
MGERATVTYTEPVTGKQKNISVPASGPVTPRNSVEQQVLAGFVGTDVMKGNELRELGDETPRRSSTRRSSRRSSPKPQPVETPAETTEG